MFTSNHIPLIRIVNGSSKFYGNLIRSYCKNHDVIHVFSQDKMVNISIWLIFNMSSEFYIDTICVSWINGCPTMSFIVHAKKEPSAVIRLDVNDGDFYVKYSKNTDLQTVKKILTSKQHASIICAGSTCYDLLCMLPSLHTIGYVYYRTEIVHTYDDNNCGKAAIKVSVIPYDHEMLQQKNI